MTRILGIIALAAFIAVPALADEAAKKEDPKETKYTAKELEEIVGPVALYPDQVLTSVLPATTVPVDIVKAARWLKEQTGEVKEAPKDSGWDDSVQALIQFPDVVNWMSENLDWMEQMGYAVANQQEAVLAAIQEFRKKTNDAGNLKSDDKQQIIVNNETQVIQIEPAQPETIYVPQYNPVYVTQPATTWPASYTGNFWAGFAVGAVGAWAVHSIRWGGGGYGHGYYGGGINHGSPYNNFDGNRNVNRNVNRDVSRSRESWSARRDSGSRKADRAPRRDNGRVSQARQPSWDKGRSRAQPGKGGVRPGAGTGSRRPSTGAPRGRPGTGFGGSRGPSRAPSLGDRGRGAGGRGAGAGGRGAGGRGAGAGGRTGARPDRRPSASSRSGLGGSRSGSSARRSSSRGHSSLGSGRSSGGRSSGARGGSRGGSRGGGARGGSRGGGSRGGGGRGGGRRR